MLARGSAMCRRLLVMANVLLAFACGGTDAEIGPGSPEPDSSASTEGGNDSSKDGPNDSTLPGAPDADAVDAGDARTDGDAADADGQGVDAGSDTGDDGGDASNPDAAVDGADAGADAAVDGADADSGGDAADASSGCDAGGACVPTNKCHVGALSCVGGTPACTDTGVPVSNGSSCGPNEVCNAGNCVSCTAGVVCTPANACHVGATSCATGTSVCGDTGNPVPNGTACDPGSVCNGGTCVACNAGASCVPSNPCYTTGQIVCSTGSPVCTPTGSPLPDGTGCGTNMVCGGGTCNACTANAPCTPGKTCHLGAISCGTGSPVCKDTGSFASDCWEPLVSAGPTARALHIAAWSGTRMVVWAGENASTSLNDGGVYDPQSDTWQAVYLVNVPGSVYSGVGLGMSGRAVFVGGLAVAGGYNKSALTYDPATGGWSSMGGSPGTAGVNTSIGAVSTGSAVVWCGSSAGGVTQNLGWVFNAFGAGGYLMSSPVPGGGAGCNRNDHSAVWTGSKVIVYGGLVNTGSGSLVQSDGNIYDLAGDTWTAFAGESFPRYPNRWDHAAVWTGSKMIVWGGGTGATFVAGAAGLTQSGGAFDPGGSTWTTLSETNAPSQRMSPAAYWTGSKMIVWGGTDFVTGWPATGAVYDPSSDTWKTMASAPWAYARKNYSVVWTGASMIVWGGVSMGPGGAYLSDGAIYHP